MTTEITNEQRARIFAAYWGCTIVDLSNGAQWDMQGLSVGYKNGVEITPEWLDFDRCNLLLSPLSKITDEHATILCKLLNIDYSNDPESESFYDLDGIMEDITENAASILFSDVTMSQLVIDTLRSFGYDLGYGSINSLIYEGLALDKTIQP